MKTLSIILFALFLAVSANAGFVILGGGSGATINSASSTNFPGAQQIGTFYLTGNVYLNYGPVTSAGGMIVKGELTLDGTNFVPVTMTYTNATTTPTTNALYQVSIAAPIYGTLNVSNSTASNITNFTGILQQ